VEFNSGERLRTHTLIWTAGISANPVVAELPVEKGSLRRAIVLPTLQLPAYPEVFALGDCAHCRGEDGAPLATTAQVANQQSPVLADNLLRALTGKPLRPFKYHHLGELMSLGANHAVADMGALKIRGFLAWWIWRTIYLYKMRWWNNRFRIMLDWTCDLVLPRDSSRVEVGGCPACTTAGCPNRQPGSTAISSEHEPAEWLAATETKV
jgi:NADH dehydrogenase